MCGRLSTHDTDSVRDVAGLLGIPQSHIDLSGIEARYNTQPTHYLPVIMATEQGLAVSPMRWGWVKQRGGQQDKRASLHINARSETVYELPTFKMAARRQRCIIVAAGYYEWHRDFQDRPLEPHYIHPSQTRWLAIAAIYHASAIGDKEVCLLTMAPNARLAQIHDRMPCMLPLEGITDWLAADTPEKGLAALPPAPNDFILEHYVSEQVNSVRNEGPQLILPAPLPPKQADFFS